jgi:hypothetical protein
MFRAREYDLPEYWDKPGAVDDHHLAASPTQFCSACSEINFKKKPGGVMAVISGSTNMNYLVELLGTRYNAIPSNGCPLCHFFHKHCRLYNPTQLWELCVTSYVQAAYGLDGIPSSARKLDIPLLALMPVKDENPSFYGSVLASGQGLDNAPNVCSGSGIAFIFRMKESSTNRKLFEPRKTSQIADLQ